MSKTKQKKPWQKVAVIGLGSILLAGIVFGLVRWKKHSQDRVPVDAPISRAVHLNASVKPSTPANEAALRDAALDGLVQTVQSLLTQGTDPNAADENGRTALMLAAFNGYTSTAQVLIDHGATLDTCDQIGRTALVYAASGPNHEVVELLLKHKANPNIIDKHEQWTALMFAAAEGQAQVVRVLLQHGADATLKDVDGDSAFNFASNNGHTEVAKILSDARKQ